MLNVNAMLETLPMMGKGMLGVFIVTVIIILTVIALNAITGEKKQ